MLVIAHPDDETMFFTPTIHELRRQGCNVTVLCLSNGEGSSNAVQWAMGSSNAHTGCSLGLCNEKCAGNYDGMGPVRGNELLAACRVLGVSIIHRLHPILLLHCSAPLATVDRTSTCGYGGPRKASGIWC